MFLVSSRNVPSVLKEFDDKTVAIEWALRLSRYYGKSFSLTSCSKFYGEPTHPDFGGEFCCAKHEDEGLNRYPYV